MTRRRAVRPGLSLLEVLIASAIFLFSLVAIARLVDSGVDLAVEMDLRSYGAMLAQSKLAQVTAGAIPLSSQPESTDEDDPDWTWAMEAEADAIPNLFRVRITVARSTAGGRVEVVAHQLVLDPTKRGSTDSSSLGTDPTTANPISPQQ